MIRFPELFFSGFNWAKPANAAPKSDISEVIDLLECYRTLHDYSVLSLEFVPESHISIRLRDEMTLVPYLKGKVCGCIPIPGKPPKRGRNLKEPWSVRSPEVVISSPNVVEALEQLSRIWRDRFAKSILISAPPGSGKEDFALSIPYGAGRNAERIRSLALAVKETEVLEQQLFGRKQGDGDIEDGLIAQASGGALFLDEAHYPRDGAGIRGSLLRPLEAGDYLPVGSNVARSVGDVLFVFASSLPLTGDKSIATLEPRDFWTRMTHVIDVKHPLDFGSTGGVSPQLVVGHFFKIFWWRSAERYFNREIDLSDVFPKRYAPEQPHTLPKDVLKHRQLSELLDQERLEEYVKTFSNSIRREGSVVRRKLATISIRGIRTMVARLFSEAATLVVRGKGLEGWDYAREAENTIEEIRAIAELKKSAVTPGAKNKRKK